MKTLIRMLVLCAAILPAGAAFAADWTVQRVTRNAQVSLDGRTWSPLARGTDVPNKAWIHTDRNGKLLLGRGRDRMWVDGDTLVRVTENGTDAKPRTAIEHRFGEIIVDVQKRGYDQMNVKTPFMAAVVKGTKFTVTGTELASSLRVARGLVEAVTWSFIPKSEALMFGGGDNALDLSNPMSVDMSSMRPSLLPELLKAARRNANRGLADAALFEVGQSYRGTRPEDQFTSAAGVRMGTARLMGSGRHWSGTTATVDAFDAKADVAALLAALGFDPSKPQIVRDAPGYYHPGRSGTLRLGPKVVLAHFGEVHPATLAALDIDAPVVAFEVFVDSLPAEKRKATRARPPLEGINLMPLSRDFAFIVGRDVAAGDVVRAATGADKALIRDVDVFDVFEAGRLAEEGKKSLAIAVTLQPREQALTEKEIEAVSQKIISAVTKATGGEIRS